MRAAAEEVMGVEALFEPELEGVLFMGVWLGVLSLIGASDGGSLPHPVAGVSGRALGKKTKSPRTLFSEWKGLDLEKFPRARPVRIIRLSGFIPGVMKTPPAPRPSVRNWFNPDACPRGLPSAHQRKLTALIRELEAGKNHRDCGGKKLLPRFPTLISVPLGRRWRALFAETPTGLRFRECLSHESYNKMHFSHLLP